MSKRKNNIASNVPATFVLESQLKPIVENLFYMSETDAQVLPFVGKEAAEVTAEEILKQTGNKPDAQIEQRDFGEFFEKLTKIQDWFGDEEKTAAAKFAALKDLLEKNLRDLKVYKIGTIQLDLYIVGLPAENILSGVKTKAVET